MITLNQKAACVVREGAAGREGECMSFDKALPVEKASSSLMSRRRFRQTTKDMLPVERGDAWSRSWSRSRRRCQRGLSCPVGRRWKVEKALPVEKALKKSSQGQAGGKREGAAGREGVSSRANGNMQMSRILCRPRRRCRAKWS